MQQSNDTMDVRFDPLFGLIAENIGWVPSVRYLLRRKRLVKLLEQVHFDSILEIGCGSGSLLVEIARNTGLHTQGLETSVEARAMANQIIDLAGANVQIHATPLDNWNERYDLICAFEVLEHIDDDLKALSDWFSWIKSGGFILISVPAHRRRWGYGDVWAGHYRRYDISDLKSLVADAGLSIEHIECYGFPLANLTEKVGNSVYRKKIETHRDSMDRPTATAGSGVNRDSYLKIFRWMNNPIGRISIGAAFFLQHLFHKSHLGSGYIVLAKKP